MEVLKFRTLLTGTINKKKPRHYGHIKVVNFEQDFLKIFNKSNEVCIMQDFSSNSLLNFKKEFSSIKINAIRTKMSNTKIVDYNIEGEFDSNQKNPKIIGSDIVINFLIYTLTTLRKVKRALGY
jgi:hypothetical protein